MRSISVSKSPEDDLWDAKYFGLILELTEKNASRYEVQTFQLLKEKFLEVETNGFVITYTIHRTGCSSSFAAPEGGHGRRSWVRMGWKKSSKIKALPNFFASSEANMLLGLD